MSQAEYAEPRRAAPLSIALAGAFALAGTLPFGPKAMAFGALLFLAACLVALRDVRAPVVAWPNAAGALLLIIWLIPIKSYRLPVDLPFNLEVYRLYLLVLIIAWLVWATGGRGRITAGGLGPPLILLAVVAVGSQLVNLGRLGADGSGAQAIKSLSYFLGFLLVFVLICSTTERLRDVERLVRVLVVGGAVVAVAALYESRTRDNLFDRLHTWIPALVHQERDVLALRGGQLRVHASAQHPIALSSALVMMIPLSIYLAGQAVSVVRSRLWLAAGTVTAMGAFATVSRTTVVMLAAMVLVALWLRGKAVSRFWPVLILLPVVIHFATPGVLGGIRNSFFPKGGLVSDLQGRPGEKGSGRFADIEPGLDRWAASPLVGHGLGSQAATGATPTPPSRAGEAAGVRLIFDDQYMNTLVELGILGLAGAIWFIWGAAVKLTRSARHVVGRYGDLITACGISCAGFAASLFLYDGFAFVQATLLFFIVAALGLKARQLAIANG